MPLNLMYERIDNDLQDDFVGASGAAEAPTADPKHPTALRHRAHHRQKKHFRLAH
jgi:hypothetical protein